MDISLGWRRSQGIQTREVQRTSSLKTGTGRDMIQSSSLHSANFPKAKTKVSSTKPNGIDIWWPRRAVCQSMTLVHETLLGWCVKKLHSLLWVSASGSFYFRNGNVERHRVLRESKSSTTLRKLIEHKHKWTEANMHPNNLHTCSKNEWIKHSNRIQSQTQPVLEASIGVRINREHIFPQVRMEKTCRQILSNINKVRSHPESARLVAALLKSTSLTITSRVAILKHTTMKLIRNRDTSSQWKLRERNSSKRGKGTLAREHVVEELTADITKII